MKKITLEILNRTQCPFREESNWTGNPFCMHPLREERKGNPMCQPKHKDIVPGDFPPLCPLTEGETVPGGSLLW